MKFLHITFHFEFSEQVEKILDEAGIESYVRYAMVQGKDREGKHFGSKVFPGSTTVVQAQVPDGKMEKLLEKLKDFREDKKSHRHMTVTVMAVEESIGD